MPFGLIRKVFGGGDKTSHADSSQRTTVRNPALATSPAIELHEGGTASTFSAPVIAEGDVGDITIERADPFAKDLLAAVNEFSQHQVKVYEGQLAFADRARADLAEERAHTRSLDASEGARDWKEIITSPAGALALAIIAFSIIGRKVW